MKEQIDQLWDFVDKNRRLTGIGVFFLAIPTAFALALSLYGVYRFIAWWGARGYIFFM